MSIMLAPLLFDAGNLLHCEVILWAVLFFFFFNPFLRAFSFPHQHIGNASIGVEQLVDRLASTFWP